MPDEPTDPVDELRTQTDETLAMLRKGVLDLRHTVEVSRNVIRESRDALQAAEDVTAHKIIR